MFPRIYQYKLKNPLKYALNPASQLEVVSIDAAIIYEIGQNEANISVDTTLQMVREISTSLGPPFIKSPLAFYGPVSMTKLGSRYNDLSFVERLNESGIQVDLWPKADITTSNNNSKGVNDAGKITYSTGFYPFQCLDEQRVLLAIPSPSPGADSLTNRLNFGDFTYEPQFKLKLKVLLKRTDAEAMNTNTEYVVIMASYQVKLDSTNTSPGTYYVSHLAPWTTPVCNQTAKYMKDYVVTSLFSPSGTPIAELGGNGLPMDLSLTGVEITTDREALRKITLDNCWIGSSQTFIPPPPSAPEDIIYGPPVIIRAGKSIEVLSSSNTSNLFQTASLLVGVPSRFGGCDGSPLPPPVSATEIQSFCENGNLYKPYILPNKLAASNLLENPIPLTAFPNPFTGEITLRFELLQTTEVSITLYDLLGRPVMPIRKSEPMKAGPQELTVDMGFLAAGVYIVVMDADGQRRTVRIVKE
ncbi:MAG: T9SS type A sorting domain-containing protein [Bacteroidia bacterium]